MYFYSFVIHSSLSSQKLHRTHSCPWTCMRIHVSIYTHLGWIKAKTRPARQGVPFRDTFRSTPVAPSLAGSIALESFFYFFFTGISNTFQCTDNQKRTPMCSSFSYNTLQLRTTHFFFPSPLYLKSTPGNFETNFRKKNVTVCINTSFTNSRTEVLFGKAFSFPLLAFAVQFALKFFHLLIPLHWINPELLCCLKLWESPEKIYACSHLLGEQDRVFAEKTLRKEGCVIPVGKCPRSLRKRI